MKTVSTSLALALALLLATVAEGREEVIPLESPAWFVQAEGGYRYGRFEASTSSGGSTPLPVPESTSRSWFAGGLATLPIARGFGARLVVDGGGERLSGALAVTDDEVTGGAELFWRDPTKGQVGVGYAYTWAPSTSIFGPSTSRSHTAPVFASLYMPSFDGNTVDWNVRFEYSWIDVENPSGHLDQWAYDVVGSSRWYVDRWASFEGGVRFAQQINALPSNVVEGVFQLEFLIPGGARHYGTFSLLGSVGRRAFQDLGPQFGMASQLTWQIGFGATVHFPGVVSLVELHRAYR